MNKAVTKQNRDLEAHQTPLACSKRENGWMVSWASSVAEQVHGLEIVGVGQSLLHSSLPCFLKAETLCSSLDLCAGRLTRVSVPAQDASVV